MNAERVDGSFLRRVRTRGAPTEKTGTSGGKAVLARIQRRTCDDVTLTPAEPAANDVPAANDAPRCQLAKAEGHARIAHLTTQRHVCSAVAARFRSHALRRHYGG